ncbi:taurine ABC transporter substrate-binding protein [Petrotoga mexicana DSM 14811]|uniref:Taurine ABC transporter substrate-binding protein n=1 Tax=Petrotoga mexicana DSM 14811 TaxID=1122954 RepID=A0A2K1P752_9BACT|nr:ABC transporter substrate-binding protein [Petrotoga mexicana]PNR98628.1 taurine ABC transporter substrate-binding protein [Petrotoga mexicana DSM 14811]
MAYMKSKLVKSLLFFVLITLITLIFTSCNKGQQDLPKEINIGILRVPNDETIAIEQGLFDKYFSDKGIQCNFIVFDSGVEANQAFASGSIDFATMGNINSIIAFVRNLDVELIWIHEVLGDIEALVVRENDEINSINDLVGKKIATPFASTSHYILLNILKEAGIEEKVQLLDMKTTEIVAAWSRGDIDAAYTWQPSLGELIENGGRVLISSEDMLERGYITANVALVSKNFSEKYPDLVVSFIDCLAEANDIYLNDPERAAEIVSRNLGISPETALIQMQGSIWLTREEMISQKYMGTSEKPGNFVRVMKDTSDFLKAQGFIENSPSLEEFSEYINPYYIEKSLEKDDEI